MVLARLDGHRAQPVSSSPSYSIWTISCAVHLQSIAQHVLFRNGTSNENPKCLQDIPVEVEPNHLDTTTLPGQLFTADEQCELAYGLNFRLRTPPGIMLDVR
jgi:hypothetical protein